MKEEKRENFTINNDQKSMNNYQCEDRLIVHRSRLKLPNSSKKYIDIHYLPPYTPLHKK